MKTLFSRRLLLPAVAVVLASGSLLEGFVTSNKKWGTSTVHYYVNPQNKHMSEATAISAIQMAAASWHEQSNANIQLAYAGQTSGSSLGMNYKSEVFFRGGSSSYVAEGFYWYDGSGKIVDGDIVFYEDAYKYFAFSGCANSGLYLENVAIHEFGHILGLHHSSVANVTMQPKMASYCDRTQLTLEADDKAGIESLYPPSDGSGSGSTSNTAPTVTITAPTMNASFAKGVAIGFSGSATDSEDGNLSASIRWRSDVVGLIGTGASISTTLPLGTHLITAKVTDSAGVLTTKQITIFVVSTVDGIPAVGTTPTPGPLLTATGYKVKGMQKVDLDWSGFTTATVDVYRNGVKLGTTANTGSGTDPVNLKGGGSYTYKVCGTGTTVCSNQASVNF